MFRKAKLVLATVIALVMLIGTTVIPVTAENGEENGGNQGPITQEAAITKLFRMPVGTEMPVTTFTFNVASVMVNGYPATTENSIAVGPFNIASSALQPRLDPPNPVGGNNYFFAETADIFAGVNWPHAGVFTFRVTERDDTYTSAVGTMTFSQATFYITVHVINNDDGELEILGIGTMRERECSGEPITPVKVDATPEGGYDFDFSQMIFTNSYSRRPLPVDPTTDSTLEISKTVTGDLGNRMRYFDFSITVNAPQIAIDQADAADLPFTFAAYIVNLVDGGADVVVGTTRTITHNELHTFQLRHGQALRFVNTHVGATYTVTETGVPLYYASVIVTSAGALFGSQANQYTGEDLATSGLVAEAADLTVANSAAFTNLRHTPPLVGLDVETLSFIGLFAIGLGAFLVLIVIKRKKRSYYYYYG